MKARYYNWYPRNFNNEYISIRVENKQELELLNGLYNDLPYGSSIHRVTLKDLRKLWATEKDRQKYDRASAFHCDPNNPISFFDFALDYHHDYFHDYLFN